MRRTLTLLALAACASPEKGIDRSVLTGTLTIPAASVDEVDTRTQPNNDLADAQPLGVEGSSTLTYRALRVSGSAKDFTPEGIGEAYGDPDYYAFTPAAAGSWTLTLQVGAAARRGPPPPPDTGTTDTGATDTGTTDTGTTDTGATDTGTTDTAVPGFADPVVFAVEVYDLATYDGAGNGVLFRGTTDGSGGLLEIPVELAAGGDYVVMVAGLASDTGNEAPYTLTLPGSDPSTAGILVGAYAGADPTVAEDPLGGATATDWAQDPDTLAWSARYEIMGLRALVNVADTDTADDEAANPELTEGADTVYLRAATVPVLNASPAAGALYSSASVSVAPTGGPLEVGETIVLDGVFPKVVGLTITETEESSCVVTADTTLEESTLVAQDVGMVSGLGFVDVFDGTIDFDPTVEGWEGNDSDVFAFTVPEPMYVRMTVGWADAAADIDVGIFGTYEDYGLVDWFSGFGDSYCLSSANPEVCETVVPLEPGVPYYLAVLGYLGTDAQAWHAELEWVAP